MNPAELVSMWDNKNFVVVCVFDGTKDGKQVQIVEVKPLNKKTEYAKAKITVNKSNGQLSAMELINKDGSKYNLTITKNMIAKAASQSLYTFNKAKYPGYQVEDLRI